MQTEQISIAGYKAWDAMVEHHITAKDRLVKIVNGEQPQVLQVLLTRDDHVICALSSDKPGHYRKIHVGFTQATSMPVLCGGATYQLFVPEQEPAALANDEASGEPAPEAKKRGRKVEGETKLEKCRRIFKQHPAAVKADVIALFISDAACTAGGANTYYCLLKKE